MKKKYIIFILIVAVIGTWGSCKSDFLTVTPKGSLDQGLLQTSKGIDALLIGCYAMLDGADNQGFSWEPAASNWVWGSIRGLEANKGSNSGDQQDIQPIQGFTEEPTNSYLNAEWKFLYEAISRCNNTIIITNKALAASKITQDEATSFLKQAKTMRGWYHFQAWRNWNKIPYVDETTDPLKVTNSADITDKIIADLGEGTDLPNNMGQVGRFNGTVAKALKAEALMQISHDYAGALTLLKDIIATGTKPDGSKIGLAPTYGEIFDIENRNGIEAVYTVQFSVNDNSGGYNGGEGEVLNFPYKGGGSPGGCCGFFQPTQEFVNSFRVGADGLPMLDFSYNSAANQILRDEGVAGGGIWDATKTYDVNQGCTAYTAAAPFQDLGYVSLIKLNKGNNPLTSPAAWKLTWTEDNSKAVDPRLDWSVGRRGIPYWDWGVHTGSDWIRDQTYAGPYSPKKQVYKKSQEGKYTEVGNWTSGWTANGTRLIRFADILLLAAECEIQTGDLAGALANVNLVRNRAANPAGFVMESDGVTPAATYSVSPYPAFPTKDYAMSALMMERKLELGQEGHRYFDLQRWGIVKSELNRALAYEETMDWGTLCYNKTSVSDAEVTLPIPQRQIDLSNGNIVQNTGH